MAEGSPMSALHTSIIRWIADNFYVCEGCTVPRWLLYELYVESCSPNSEYAVNSSTFGKLIRCVFPCLGTRRLGTRGCTRYHYSGIAIKNNSSFYAHYYFLLSETSYQSGNAVTSGNVAGRKSNSLKKRKVFLLANEYYSHCQDILHMVRNNKLDKVGGYIMSFWNSLQPERTALMSFPGVCQMLKSCDRQLFKDMENILFHDFLEEVPVQRMRSIISLVKNAELWLLNPFTEFPSLLRTYRSQEVKTFKQRLKRKIDLSNMAKSVRTVLNSSSKLAVLRSGLHAVIVQGFLDVPGNLFQNKLCNPEELQNDIELKCLYDLISLLESSTDIRVLLHCVSSNLHDFVIQPGRSKKEFRKLASDFQLRWNFLLTAVSKALTLNYTDSFGFWCLFNLLLVEFVGHVFLSYIEEGDESFYVAEENKAPVVWVYEPSQLWGWFAVKQPQGSSPQTTLTTLMQNQNIFGLSNILSEF